MREKRAEKDVRQMPSRGGQSPAERMDIMAALKDVCRRYKGEIEDGIAWVAIWRTGRSWNAEAFFDDACGSYEDGYRFEAEDMERMQEIIKEDCCAVMLNGYYTNCGTIEWKTVPLADIVYGVEWNYYNRHNQLFDFYDRMVIKDLRKNSI